MSQRPPSMSQRPPPCPTCGTPAAMTQLIPLMGGAAAVVVCPMCIDSIPEVVEAKSTVLRLIGAPTYEGIRERVQQLSKHPEVDSVNVTISQLALDIVAEEMREAGLYVGPGGLLDVEGRRFLGGRLYIRELEYTALLEGVSDAPGIDLGVAGELPV